MDSEINSFIEILASVQASASFFNQYSHEVSVNCVRRKNLFLYLQQMANIQPQILLVGEAPGYRGCRLTGVPFTSEFILLEGLEQLGLFGESRGYGKTEEFRKTMREASASIVWKTLVTTPRLPLIWNAFPFHPFQAENEQSNRKPTRNELTIGKEFLQELIQLFDIKTVIAVGNTADATLNVMGITCEKVRHPSYGGKTLFIKGIKAVMNPRREDVHRC